MAFTLISEGSALPVPARRRDLYARDHPRREPEPRLRPSRRPPRPRRICGGSASMASTSHGKTPRCTPATLVVSGDEDADLPRRRPVHYRDPRYHLPERRLPTSATRPIPGPGICRFFWPSAHWSWPRSPRPSRRSDELPRRSRQRRARERDPRDRRRALTGVEVRFRGQFASSPAT
jgi:hypothetical protein